MGTWRIKACGARGGTSTDTDTVRGAYLEGDVTLTAGDILYIIVGQPGSTDISGKFCSGGGASAVLHGASFLSAVPLAVAGGGAGKGKYVISQGNAAGNTGEDAHAGSNNLTISTGGGFAGTTGKWKGSGGGALTAAGEGNFGGNALIAESNTGGLGSVPGGFGGGAGADSTSGSGAGGGGGYTGGNGSNALNLISNYGGGGSSWFAGNAAFYVNETAEGYVDLTYNPQIPIIITQQPVYITTVLADLYASYISLTPNVKAMGICWSTDDEPTILDYLHHFDISEGTFSYRAEGLPVLYGVLIYARAFVTVNSVTYYGNTRTFSLEGEVLWNGQGTDPDWNNPDNWRNQILPDPFQFCSINGTNNNPTISNPWNAPAICSRIGFYGGFSGSITINPNSALTMNKIKSGNPDYFLLKSDATGTGSLITGGSDQTIPFNGTLERYISGSEGLQEMQYHLVSIPFDPSTDNFSSLWMDSYLYEFNTALNRWEGLGIATDTPLDERKGYMVYYPGESKVYTFKGLFNNSNFNPLVLMQGEGFNLVPNPYTSALDWDLAVRHDISGAVWQWPAGGSNYASYIGGSSTNGGSGIIPTGQAFFVQATGASPELWFTNNMQVHSNGAFFKKPLTWSELRIHAEAENKSDEALVKFVQNATPGYDPDLDAPKMFGNSNAPQLYTTSCTAQSTSTQYGSSKLNSTQNTGTQYTGTQYTGTQYDSSKLNGTQYTDWQYSINAMPELHEKVIIPLYYENETESPVTLTFSQFESFAPGLQLSLEDKITGEKTNLRTAPTYTFEHRTTDQPDRFLLVLGGPLLTEDIPSNDLSILFKEQTITISTDKYTGKHALIQVYGINGTLLLQRELSLQSITHIPAPATGLLITKVTIGNTATVKQGLIL